MLLLIGTSEDYGKINQFIIDTITSTELGRIQALRTETFGGGTEITTTGLLTSLPTQSFDSMQFYLPVLLEGRVYHRHDHRPLFLYVLTIAAHAPYDFRFDPSSNQPGEPFGNSAECIISNSRLDPG